MLKKTSKKKSSVSSTEESKVEGQKHAHDLTVKKVCEDHRFATEILKLVLTPRESEALDWDTLELKASTFINEKLKEDRTDLIFFVKFKNSRKSAQVVFLIEHKSYNDPHIMDQILRYQAASYRRTKAPILPIIIYNGKNKKYKGELGFRGYLENCPDPHFRRGLSKNVLNFSCRILNLRELSVQKLSHLTAAPILFILGNVWEVNRKVIEKLFLMIKKLPEKKDREALFHLAVNYIMSFDKGPNKGNRKLHWEIILEVEKDVFKEEKGMIQQFKLSIEKTAEKKGRKETQREIAMKLLKKGMEVSYISEITGISEDEVKNLQNKEAS